MRVVAHCLLEHNDQILLQEFLHEHDHYTFLRPIGGGVEPGEYAAEALRREIREELDAEISDPELLDVLENIFEYGDKTRHEIIFLFRAALLDTRLTSVSEFRFFDNGNEFRAVWKPIAELMQGGSMVLYPVALQEQLKKLYPAIKSD